MSTKHYDEVVSAPELEPLNLEDKPDGPGAAMMISAGIGIFVLGILTVIAEFNTAAKNFLQWWQWGVGAGPLAGKTTLAVLAFILSLIVLWAVWRRKDVNIKKAFYIGLVLGILGAVGTFPTFFQLFAAH